MSSGLKEYLVGALTEGRLAKMANILNSNYLDREDTMRNIAKLLGNVVASKLLDGEQLVSTML